MRLWHKDLISVLPRQQLLGQWRELCCIARNIKENGTPNHILVNKIMEYPYSHLNAYATIVYNEMVKRGYKCSWEKYCSYNNNNDIVMFEEIFSEWHNERYLDQCYYNLQEKYDCNGISEDEWHEIEAKYLFIK